MEFFKQNTRINFMGLKVYAAIFSILLVVASFTTLAINGLNWGLEFTGGTEIYVNYQGPANLDMVRSDLGQAGFTEAVVQTFGATSNVLIRIGGHQDLGQSSVSAKVIAALLA